MQNDKNFSVLMTGFFFFFCVVTVGIGGCDQSDDGAVNDTGEKTTGDTGTSASDSDSNDTSPDSDSVTGDGSTGSESESETHADLWDWTCPSVVDQNCGDHLIMSGLMTMGAYSPAITIGAGATEGVTPVDFASTTEIVLASHEVDGIPLPLLLVGEKQVPIESEDHQALVPRGIAATEGIQYSSGGFNARREILGELAVLLLCKPDSCGLHALRQNDDGVTLAVVELAGGTVPLAAPGGIAVIDDDLLCVAGAGIACFDGSAWEMPVSSDAGLFTRIDSNYGSAASDSNRTFSTGIAVAVGAGGLMWTNHGGTWHQLETGVNIDFTTVSVGRGVVSAGGNGGFIFSDYTHVSTCALSDETVSVTYSASYWGAFPDGDVSAITAITETGSMIQVWKSPENSTFQICRRNSGITGVPIRADAFPGVEMLNSAVLSTSGLFMRTDVAIGE
jgi:hypothetical protein